MEEIVRVDNALNIRLNWTRAVSDDKLREQSQCWLASKWHDEKKTSAETADRKKKDENSVMHSQTTVQFYCFFVLGE